MIPFQIDTLGQPEHHSPLALSIADGDGVANFVSEETRVLFEHFVHTNRPSDTRSLELAGPRQNIFFQPQQCRAAVVTCGGLCPGINNVIRSIFIELHHNYGVQEVLGIRQGYLGLDPAHGEPPKKITSEFIEVIHTLGGTVLGSSRGPRSPEVMVDFLQSQQIDMLFCIGGDGTQRGAHAIAQEVNRRGEKIAVVGVPKTIDNDIPYVYRSFGYATALEKAAEVIRAAHVEAKGAINGVGLVKLMGRDAGFIAAGATLASQEVNFVLVPEIDFSLTGFLAALEKRLHARKHAVIVVSEGTGQHLLEKATEQDLSGNRRYADIGLFLKQKILAHFASKDFSVNVKYLDPSYLIRSVPANSADRILSDQLARHAVHAAMAGKTNMLVGHWNNEFVHVPIPAVVSEKKILDLEGQLWRSTQLATGQPRWPPAKIKG
jgi:6-phosphofructokinase 1